MTSLTTGVFPPPLFTPFGNPLEFPLAMGVVYLLYFSLLESSYGQTLGKRIMRFKVETTEGKTPSLEKSFLRNVSKIYWIFLLIDVLAGLGTYGDARQKYMDRVAGSVVIEDTARPIVRLLP